MPGYINVDSRKGDGVDLVLNLDDLGPHRMLPWPTASVDEVAAYSLLEHLWKWEGLFLEVARILIPGGLFRIRVPYKTNHTPYHVRFFDRKSFDPFREDASCLRYDLRRERHHRYASLEFRSPLFTLEKMWVERFYPFAWHLANHGMGDFAYRLPFGPARNLHVTLKRNGMA